MDALVTYDVSGKQVEVRAVMLARGYHEHGTSPRGKHRVPSPALWRKDTGVLEALQDIEAAASECRVTLERALVVPSGR